MKKLFPIFYIAALLVFALPAEGQQKVRTAIRKGHSALKKEEYATAETAYRKALAQDSTLAIGHYSLGNALYKQGKYKEALEEYGRIQPEHLEDVNQAAQLFHNIGNAQLQQKKFAEAAESFKQSLRLNPTDDETRYNLALALKQIPPEDKNKGRGAQNQPQPQPQEQKPQPPKEQNKEQGKPEQPQKNEKIDPKTAEKILDAYQQDEDESRKRYEARRQQGQQQRQDKNKKRW